MIFLIQGNQLEAGTRTVSLLLSESCQYVRVDFDEIDTVFDRSQLFSFGFAHLFFGQMVELVETA